VCFTAPPPAVAAPLPQTSTGGGCGGATGGPATSGARLELPSPLALLAAALQLGRGPGVPYLGSPWISGHPGFPAAVDLGMPWIPVATGHGGGGGGDWQALGRSWPAATAPPGIRRGAVWPPWCETPWPR
jgi:hypothetical protein